MNSVSQLPQEEASICHLATTHPSLKGPPLTAPHPQKSTNQSGRPLTHSMIICALEESVSFVLGYSGLGKKKIKTRRYYARRAGQGLSTLLQDIVSSNNGSFFKVIYSSGVLQRALQCSREVATSSSVDEAVMSPLAECYFEAYSWETRRKSYPL